MNAAKPQSNEVINVTVEATIRHYGLHVSFHGMPGIVRVPELSWGWVGLPSDFANEGDQLQVRVLGWEHDGFSSSLKAVHPENNPWRDPSRFAVGDPFRGTVRHIGDYGYLIERDDFACGILRFEHATMELTVGDTIESRVYSVNTDRQILDLRMQ